MGRVTSPSGCSALQALTLQGNLFNNQVADARGHRRTPPPSPKSQKSPRHRHCFASAAASRWHPPSPSAGIAPTEDEGGSAVMESSASRRRGPSGQVLGLNEEHVPSCTRLQRRSPVSMASPPLRDPRVVALRASASLPSRGEGCALSGRSLPRALALREEGRQLEKASPLSAVSAVAASLPQMMVVE